MSTFYHATVRCAVCKAKSEQTLIGSTNTFGSPDLDLRPPEMQRSTMMYWVKQCPRCGYTAYDLEVKTKLKKKWLSSEPYINCEGHSFENELAEKFYKVYMIAKETGNSQDAFTALLRAAWASDDRKDYDNAVLCRKLLLPYLEAEIAKEPAKAETLSLVRADVMRRIGMFEELIEEYSDKKFSEKLLNEICQFQIEKAKQKDTARYLVADAHNSED